MLTNFNNHDMYSLGMLTPLNEIIYIIEQGFLKNVKTDNVPNLGKDLSKLSTLCRTQLLANNCRSVFLCIVIKNGVRNRCGILSSYNIVDDKEEQILRN